VTCLDTRFTAKNIITRLTVWYMNMTSFVDFRSVSLKNKNGAKSVGMITNVLASRPSDWGSILGKGKRFFSSPNRRN